MGFADIVHVVKSLYVAAFFCVLFGFGFQARGQSISAVDSERVRTEIQIYELQELRKTPIYQETYNQCRKRSLSERPSNFTKYRLQIATNSGQQVFKVAALLNVEEAFELCRNKGISESLNRLLQSKEFYLALNECYPSDPYQQSKYFLKLLQADVNGKLVGSATAFAAWASGIGVAKLIGLGGAILVSSVKYVGFGLGLVSAGRYVDQIYQNKKREERTEPSDGFVEMRDTIRAQQQIPNHAIQLLDQRMAELQEQLIQAKSSIEQAQIESKIENLRIRKIDLLMAQEEILKKTGKTNP